MKVSLQNNYSAVTSDYVVNCSNSFIPKRMINSDEIISVQKNLQLSIRNNGKKTAVYGILINNLYNFGQLYYMQD